MSSRSGVKVFGQFFGLGREAFKALGPDLRRLDEAEVDHEKVEIMHEGRLPQLPALMARVQELLPEGKKGYVDVIDHDANTMARYVITREAIDCKEVPLDDAVPAYSWSG